MPEIARANAEAVFGKLKKRVKADYNSKGQVNWRREAREDFDFEAGEQLSRLRLLWSGP